MKRNPVKEALLRVLRAAPGQWQSGEYGWLDYINHFSAEWQEEYAHYLSLIHI